MKGGLNSVSEMGVEMPFSGGLYVPISKEHVIQGY